MIIQIALKELWNGRKHLWMPGLAFLLGIAGVFFLWALEFRISSGLESEGRSMLGGDIEISHTEPLSESVVSDAFQITPKSTQSVSLIELNTMAQPTKGGMTQLVKLTAFEGPLPLYGHYEISPVGSFVDLNSEKPKIFVSIDLSKMLELEVGEGLTLGATSFLIAGIIVKSPEGIAGRFNLAPTVWIHQRHLEKTRLIERPGRVSYSQILAWPETRSVDARVIAAHLLEKFSDKNIRVKSFNNSERAFQRIFDQIERFASLVAFFSILVAALAILSALQNWLRDRRYFVALLKASGASEIQIRAILLVACLSFAAIVSIAGILAGTALDLLILPRIKELVNLSFNSSLPLSIYAMCFALGIAVVSIFSLISFRGYSEYRPIILLRDVQATSSVLKSNRLTKFVFFILAFLVSSLILIHEGLYSEFSIDSQTRQSSLFLFDVGEDEKAKIDSVVGGVPKAEVRWTPWVRLRLLRINGKPLEMDLNNVRRTETEFLVTDFLTPPPQEKVTDGELWSKAYESGVVEVSVARDYAKARGINLSDELDFELFGVPIKSKVTSLRAIRWTDFQPSFRFAFQGGVFALAPYSYLAGILTPTDDLRLQIKSILAAKLPSVSVLDVSDIKAELVRLMDKISYALNLILGFFIFVSLAILAALAREKSLRRTTEFAILRCVGASKRQLMRILALEFVQLSAWPLLIGTLCGGLLGTYLLQRYLLIPGIHWNYSFFAVPFVFGITAILTGLIFASSLTKVSPKLLFADH